MHYLKLSFAKRIRSLRRKVEVSPFCRKRTYDRNIRDIGEFNATLDYVHANPVRRGLVGQPGDWKWSSFRHYAWPEVGVVEIESEWTARDREWRIHGGPPRI